LTDVFYSSSLSDPSRASTTGGAMAAKKAVDRHRKNRYNTRLVATAVAADAELFDK
jgi:hypothetical protein